MGDMSALDASIKEIDQKIERMYDEEELRQLEYQLHAVMVHEGGVDSGHYWAYVKDHKKQVCKYKIEYFSGPVKLVHAGFSSSLMFNFQLRFG